MFLKRLEIQGFKTFAQRTVLEFIADKSKNRGVTGIVGPNGSGKSNIADAIRWVMGEQSMKLLRSKRSEDVIFSGSAKKSRAGFAEVSLTLLNDDKPDIEMHEIVVTRRLYRDGQSEYLVNGKDVRLADVALLLAQCGIGQRTYSVIGQGMVDAVLSATPTERKEFFDEAAGLRTFQLKRGSAVNKLDASRDNLKQAEMLLREIEPRLTSLERQVKRLRQREALEAELKTVESSYFGSVWRELRGKMGETSKQTAAAQKEFEKKNAEIEAMEAELAAMEKAAPVSDEVRKIRTSIDALKEERSKLREQQIRLEAQREAKAASAHRPWAPLPLSKIIEKIESLTKRHDELFVLIEKGAKLDKLQKIVRELKEESAELLSKLQQPAPEPEKERTDPDLEKELAGLLVKMSKIAEEVGGLETELRDLGAKEDKGRARLFEVQRALTAKRHEAQKAEQRLNETNVEMARFETRHDALLSELRQQAPQLETGLEALAQAAGKLSDLAPAEQLQSRMQRLRSQLEWIGGIDPETLKEYDTTKTRFEELSTHSTDLKQAIASLETVIVELDRTIKQRGDVAFRELDQEFGKYFKILFGGGDAKLIKLEPEPIESAALEGEGAECAAPDEEDEERYTLAGVDIQATPPGKRLKSIALLSGGERALTSIALICAIMAINPSPFVVLDEVDAALDEANSLKFAGIVDSLADRTQFVIVTHNRATMNKAGVLYGVTMGDDGVSMLLSVNLEKTKN
ncbi:MAG: AAA family ATPase [Patescibacteria group bacterium]